MNVIARPLRLTAEQFEELSDHQGLELLDGVVTEKNMGAEASFIQRRLSYLLSGVVEPTGLGYLFESECMYACFPSRPNRVRKPDVSFVRRDRMPPEGIPRGMFRVAPDLAAEVVSPNDEYDDIDEKVADYYDAGVPLVWVVSPKTRTVLVYRPDGSARRLRETDDLTADPVVPGFRVRIADLFPNPPAAAPAPPAPPSP